MPLFRSYPQATSLEENDAFVIDRIGVGTMQVDASVIEGGSNSPVGFRVEQSNDAPMTSASDPTPPLDDIIWDSNNGFQIATPPGDYHSLGPTPMYIFPATAPWFVHAKAYFSDLNSTNHSVQMQANIILCNSEGSQINDYVGGMAKQTIGNPGSNQYTIEISSMIMANAGDFIMFFVDDETNSAWSSTTITGNDSGLFSNTFMEGWQIH